MVAINFALSSEEARSGQISAARLVNGYTEQQGQGGKTPTPIYVVPGLTRWDDSSSSDATRLLLEVPNKGLYAIRGNAITRFYSGTLSSAIGTLPGPTDKPVQAVSNIRDHPEIAFVTDDGTWGIISTQTDTLAVSPDSDLPPPLSVTFLDGYFVFACSQGRMYHTQINDGDDVNALSFDSAKSRADDLACVIAHRGSLIALGVSSLEIWRNVGSTPFAFSPVQADIEIGCVSKYAVKTAEDVLIWVDDKRIVRAMQASEPMRISDHSVERALGDLTLPQLADLQALVVSFQGHTVYYLISSEWTWGYDLRTQLWHERKSRGREYWLARESAFFDGKYVVGSSIDGKLYYIDPSSYKDGDDFITLEATSNLLHGFPRGIIFDAFEVDMVRGVGVTGADVHASDPKLVLEWSDDGGATWRGGREQSIGKPGERSKHITFRKLGMTRETGRTFRLTCSAPVFKALMNADVSIRPCIR